MNISTRSNSPTMVIQVKRRLGYSKSLNSGISPFAAPEVTDKQSGIFQITYNVKAQFNT